MFAQSDNTHLPRKGKFHCKADLLFDWLGFSCFAYVELDRGLQGWSNPKPVKQEVSHTVILPLTK